jgi:hypothetical protein
LPAIRIQTIFERSSQHCTAHLHGMASKRPVSRHKHFPQARTSPVLSTRSVLPPSGGGFLIYIRLLFASRQDLKPSQAESHWQPCLGVFSRLFRRERPSI